MPFETASGYAFGDFEMHDVHKEADTVYFYWSHPSLCPAFCSKLDVVQM